MAFLTLDGLPVYAATIRRPLRGAWWADVDVDADTAPTGRLSLVGGGATLVGTVAPGRSEKWSNRTRVRLVGGAGGMGSTVPSRPYRGGTLRTVAKDLLTDAGEALAASSSSATLGVILTRWTRLDGLAGALLTQLLDFAAPGAVWRTLPAGDVVVGPVAWTPSGAELLELDELGDEQRGCFAGTDLTLDAGQTLGGRKVGMVVQSISSDEVRTEAWWTLGA